MGSITQDQSLETRLFINGAFVPSKSGKTFEVKNPATLKHVANVSEADVEDVDIAVQAAKAAFPSWSALPAGERQAWLYKLADGFEAALPEISRLEALCMGKPIHQDVSPMFTGIMRYQIGKAYDVQGETSLHTPGFVNMTFRQPFGVTAGIIPWNVTWLMLIMKLTPALITGNTMVLKTSEKCPLSPLVAGKVMEKIGFPKGVFNIVHGFGRPTGEAISNHMDIRKLSFTGSAATGRAIKKAAAESNLKNVTLELGGKSPLIIFEDADLAKAVPAAAYSILMNSGQACIASSRMYVHEKIADAFVEAMKSAMAAMGKSGDPLAEGTLRGPQADQLQFDRVMSYLQSAKDGGLEIALGGGRETHNQPGLFIEPTIIRNAPEDSKVMREEIFGPVVCINTFTDEEEVLKRANDTEYGLYGSVFTRDVSRALRVAKSIEAGTVGINCTSPMMAPDMPFGGYKQSGEGREMSKHVFDHWTELKTVLVAL